jgi:hypothetical protein
MQQRLFIFFVAMMPVFAGCAGDSAVQRTVIDQILATGVLEGKVSIGPICPVEGPGFDCDPDPSLYTSHHLLIIKDGSAILEVGLDGQGNFRTDLVAGTYLVDFAPRDIGIPGSFTPVEAVIESGKTTRLEIEIDTGIR